MVKTFFGMLVILSLPVFAFAQNEQTQQPAVQPQQPAASLPREAMVHHFRQTKDPGLLMEQLYAMNLYDQNIAREDIVARTLEKRREWTRLRQAGLHGEWNASEYAATLTRLLGRAASQTVGLGSMGVEAANGIILAYEDSMRGNRVSRSAQRLAEQLADWQESIVSPEENVVDLFQQKYVREPDFRDVWDDLFLTTYGFRPDSTNHDVLQAYPAFQNHSAILEVVALGTDHQALLTAVQDTQKQSLEVLTATRQQLSRLDLRTMEHWAQAAQQRERRRLAAIEAVELAGYRAAGNLAAIAIGLNDEVLGRQIHATNTAIFGAREALKAFEQAVELGASPRAAGLVLAGDFASLGLALIGTFADTGPNPDALILGELANLRAEVQQLRQEMHERFDQLYGLMVDGFQLVLENQAGMQRQLRSIQEALQDTRMQLHQIAGMQLDTSRLNHPIERSAARCDCRF